jgi:putative transposase
MTGAENAVIRPRHRLNSSNVIEVLADAMVERGISEHIRLDNAPEFDAVNLRKWLDAAGAKTPYIEPSSPWENVTAKASTLSYAASS